MAVPLRKFNLDWICFVVFRAGNIYILMTSLREINARAMMLLDAREIVINEKMMIDGNIIYFFFALKPRAI